jgi:hypothetical protein
MSLFDQTITLTHRNLLVAFKRHLISTILYALVLPVAFTIFLVYAKNLLVPSAKFGIGITSPVRSLFNALSDTTGGRDTVVFVNSGFQGGDIDWVIQAVVAPIKSTKNNIILLSQESQLPGVCPSSLRGVSVCYGAVVFWSSPTEGPGGIWNYTIRFDSALGLSLDVGRIDNDADIYPVPLQHAVDFAIAETQIANGGTTIPSPVLSYPYTSLTAEERTTNTRIRYMGGIINYLRVAFFFSVVSIIYHSVKFLVHERESRMSQLIEATVPHIDRGRCQIARLLAHHIAFLLIYLPGSLICSLILAYLVLVRTSVAVIVIFHLLTLLSLSSFALFISSFFGKEQLTDMPVDQEDLPSSIDAPKFALLKGTETSIVRQCGILFRKRLTIIRRNYPPYVAALLIPIIAVGLVNLFLEDYIGTGCSHPDQVAPSNIESISTQRTVKMVLGPTAWVTPEYLEHLGHLHPTVFGNNSSLAGSSSTTVANASLQLPDNIVLVDSITDFDNYIVKNHANFTPGGLYLGGPDSPPVFAYTGDLAIHSAVIVQNLLNSILTNVSIITQSQPFDVPWPAKVANTVQFIVYCGLSICAYPALFTLYPTIEDGEI